MLPLLPLTCALALAADPAPFERGGTPLQGGTSLPELAVLDLDGSGVVSLFGHGSVYDPITLWQSGPFGVAPLEIGGGEVAAVADVDGDGVLDLLVHPNTPYETHVLSQASGWTASIVLPGRLEGQDAADIDGDGDIDLVDAGPEWQENLGGGLGWISTPVPTFAHHHSVAVGDIDGDGDPDIAAAGYNRRTWFENLGTGFQWTDHPIEPYVGADGVHLADVDGDGALDILWEDGSFVDLNLQDPASPGSFLDEEVVAVAPDGVTDLAFARVGGFGELAVSTTVLGMHVVDRWQLSGATIVQQEQLGIFSDPVASLGWGDVDDDGTIDLVAGGGTDRIASWSGFPTPVRDDLAHTFPVGATVEPADFDGDGDMDIYLRDQASAWLENVDGYGLQWSRHEIPGEPGGLSVLADLDGDGDLDIAEYELASGDLLAFLADDAANDVWTSALVDGSPPSLFDIAAGDLDGDGVPEIVGLAYGDVLRWRPTGPASWQRLTVGPTILFDPDWIDVGDPDDDGDNDVLYGDTEIVWYDNRLGDASFWSYRNLAATDTVGSRNEVTVADFDLDGLSDVAGLGYGQEVSLVEQAQPFALSWTDRSFASGGLPDVVAVDDIDLDGDPDLAVAQTYATSAGLVWVENEIPVAGDWTDLTIHDLATDNHREVRLADIDGDGDPDLLSGGNSDGPLQLWRNLTVHPADDADGDGWRDAEDPCPDAYEVLPVDGDGDGASVGCDCDDADPAVSPAGAEVPYNGVDDDCDAATFDDDLDGDGHPVATDCDDTEALAAPGLAEVAYDGLDNDCDPATPDDDLDADGHPLATDCDDADPAVSPDVPEVPYDGVDNDCDPATPDDDLDGDGATADTDCDDADPAAVPGGAEVPYDGVDNDCDPATPDDDLDGDGATVDVDCDDTDPAVGPDMTEVVGNGVDDDCDPATPDEEPTTGTGGTGPGTTGGTDTGTAGGTTGGTDTGTPTTPGGGDDEDDDEPADEAGCGGCASTGAAPVGGWLVGLLLVGWRRRR